jgi:hypothetical protein
MVNRSDCAIRMDAARRQAAKAADPEFEAAWLKIADHWANLASQAHLLEVDYQETEARTGTAAPVGG